MSCPLICFPSLFSIGLEYCSKVVDTFSSQELSSSQTSILAKAYLWMYILYDIDPRQNVSTTYITPKMSFVIDTLHIKIDSKIVYYCIYLSASE